MGCRDPLGIKVFCLAARPDQTRFRPVIDLRARPRKAAPTPCSRGFPGIAHDDGDHSMTFAFPKGNAQKSRYTADAASFRGRTTRFTAKRPRDRRKVIETGLPPFA